MDNRIERRLKNYSASYSTFSTDFLSYKYENKKERLILENYNIASEYSDETELVYKLDNRQLRKIKLEILSNSVNSELLKKILEKSVNISYEDILVKDLSKELSKEIDKQVLNDLMKSK